MKPSEIIRNRATESYRETNEDTDLGYVYKLIQSILDYLDEQEIERMGEAIKEAQK